VTPDQIILHLSLVQGIGPAAVHYLIATCGSDNLHALYGASAATLQQRFRISPARAQAVADGLADCAFLERELALIERYNASWMTIAHEQYPPLLRAIHVPPPVLYWYGAAPSYANAFAIIGSRQATSYGQKAISSLVPALVAQGYTIVSGGAIGADTMAHRATLDAGGVTCVVVGAGLMHPYPTSNKRLFDEVCVRGGTILSIFPMDTIGYPSNFPERNRVIAGLSSGCLVVQAARKSGTRITAEFALEQGRDVFAIPGPFDDVLSEGCHALIKDGATLVTSISDIFPELGKEHENAQQDESQQQTSIEAAEEVPAREMPKTPTQQVLNLCARPVSTDDLMAATALDLVDLNELLFNLQISGQIAQTFTGLWHRR